MSSKSLTDHRPEDLPRCAWCGKDPLYVAYHDEVWGVPVKDDRTLFEFLTLEGAQAGLSWITILKKRDGYLRCFHDFDIERVARMTEKECHEILQDPRIVRNRLKVSSTVSNAKAVLEIQKDFGSFSKYIWSFTGEGTIKNSFTEMKELPAHTDLALALSKDLKKRGFRFVGPTIVYAFMQAVGMVNDHVTHCFRYDELSK